MHYPKSAACFLVARANNSLQLLRCNNNSRSLLFNFQPSLPSFSSNAQYSYDHYHDHQVAANVDKWKSKLNMLLLNEKDQEIVSTDKRDRRDAVQIANLAKRMGLYCRQFKSAIVASKVPLPNYRPDLDKSRPQREVVIAEKLQRKVEDFVQAHLDRLKLNSEKTTGCLDNVNSNNQVKDIDTDEYDNSSVDESVTEKARQRRSLSMCHMQRSWQDSPEGKKMMEFRKSLPAFSEKERLLEAIERNQITVISGGTGCGKTTQIPQYLLESEIESGRGAFCKIICTQPRRISAITVAERVSEERGESLGDTVGFKIRLEGMRGKKTQLLFCTSGILLRRLLIDQNLRGVTHVFVDEIHERGINEDFLLIVLKDLLPCRPDLKLILMSATLNADLFSKYFGGAPTFHIPGFTHPVRAHFLEDVLEMTGYKLSSFNEDDDYLHVAGLNNITDIVKDALSKSTFANYSPNTRNSLYSWQPHRVGFKLIEAVLCHICRNERPGAVLVFMTGWKHISRLRDQLQNHHLLGDRKSVLIQTCHGLMETSEQKLIFDIPPPNVRKIVIATNVAEASITINDIVFIIDCGKTNESSYDALNNTPCLLPSWISQASARQRRGRAGRVQPGECYHLYPKCVYEAFSEYQLPEILRTPLNSLCLQIKSLQIESIGKFLSSALEAPEPRAVQNAIDFLTTIGALDENENLTNLGKFLSILPVDPKLGKMLIMGAIFRCFDPVLTIVAVLSVRDPFLSLQHKSELKWAKSRFSAKDYSDHMVFVRAYEGWRDAKREGSAYTYCRRNILSSQTLHEIHSIRKQLSPILKEAGLLDTDASINNELCHDQSLVRAVICSGLFPCIASVNKVSIKTKDDWHVKLSEISVNAKQIIPYPWLVFNEKVKINDILIRDSTGVSDSMLILFGGALNNGTQRGHLKMLDGYVDFFMDPNLADCYLKLKGELDRLIQKKLEDPGIDFHKEGECVMYAVRELISGDRCEGRFVSGLDSQKPKASDDENKFTNDGTNPKSLLLTKNIKDILINFVSTNGYLG